MIQGWKNQSDVAGRSTIPSTRLQAVPWSPQTWRREIPRPPDSGTTVSPAWSSTSANSALKEDAIS